MNLAVTSDPVRKMRSSDSEYFMSLIISFPSYLWIISLNFSSISSPLSFLFSPLITPMFPLFLPTLFPPNKIHPQFSNFSALLYPNFFPSLIYNPISPFNSFYFFHNFPPHSSQISAHFFALSPPIPSFQPTIYAPFSIEICCWILRFFFSTSPSLPLFSPNFSLIFPHVPSFPQFSHPKKFHFIF